MSYYMATKVDLPFDDAIDRVTELLKDEGFGILTQIDVQETMRKKLDKPFRPYRILGACNPPAAFAALSAEDKIGTMLPCNVIVQEQNGQVEIAAVDPVASMQAVRNAELAEIAAEIRERLRRVIDSV